VARAVVSVAQNMLIYRYRREEAICYGMVVGIATAEWRVHTMRYAPGGACRHAEARLARRLASCRVVNCGAPVSR